MEPELFERIKRAFERRGGIIIQDEEARRYLQSRNALAATLNAQTILLRESPTRAEVFEELIHATQFRAGRVTGTVRNYYELEIEAAEKLIRCRRAYRLPNSDVRDIINRLRNLRRLFGELPGEQED
jgi:GAF domain-containing protein